MFVCFEFANLTGFSWARLRRLSDEELINAALRHQYADVYSNLAEFKADYSSYSPEVYYWTDLTGEAGSLFWNKFFGYTLFNVRLPEAVVIVASNGIAQFSRRCSANRRCSPTIAPDHPKLGIVGTVRGGPPGYAAAKAFSVRWVDGSEGSVFISGHCFAAFSQSPKPALRISAAGEVDGLTIGDQYGYRLIDIPDINYAGYGSLRIPEREFAQLRACDKAVRAVTPSGEWWQERFARTRD